jgi:hypothetical protein
MEEGDKTDLLNFLEDADARMEWFTENFLGDFIKDGDKIDESDLQTIYSSVCDIWNVEAITTEELSEAGNQLQMLDGMKGDTISVEEFKNSHSKIFCYAIKSKYCD